MDVVVVEDLLAVAGEATAEGATIEEEDMTVVTLLEVAIVEVIEAALEDMRHIEKRRGYETPQIRVQEGSGLQIVTCA